MPSIFIRKLVRLIDKKLEQVDTVALAKIVKVDLNKLRCDVKLKHKIHQKEIELIDVPIFYPKFNEKSWAMWGYSEEDTVLLLFSKYELEEQIKNKEIVDVNEILKFHLSYAFVICGYWTKVDEIPPLERGEFLILRKDRENDERYDMIKLTKNNEVYITQVDGADVNEIIFYEDHTLNITQLLDGHANTILFDANKQIKISEGEDNYILFDSGREITIQHHTGSYIKFRNDGVVEIYGATDVVIHSGNE